MNRFIAALTVITALVLIPTTTAQADPLRSSPEYRAALSKDASDMRGIEPSLYRGEWHNPRYERFRLCVLRQESHGNYHAANPSSSARGAYQFLDRSWRQGLVWMMLAESRKTGDGLAPHMRKLRDKPINQWSRYWQDRAFWTAFRHGEGAKHWYLAGGSCNGLA